MKGLRGVISCIFESLRGVNTPLPPFRTSIPVLFIYIITLIIINSFVCFVCIYFHSKQLNNFYVIVKYRIWRYTCNLFMSTKCFFLFIIAYCCHLVDMHILFSPDISLTFVLLLYLIYYCTI